MLKIFFFLIYVSLFFLSNTYKSYAISKWSCIGAFTGEVIFPGLGYGLLGYYDKMLIFGGSRWASLNKYWNYSESKQFEDNPDKIYKYTNLENGKRKIDIYLNKEIFYGNSFNTIYINKHT